ncbi:hypothetical protein CRM22_000394 [Opisthorchis felineus]|uniref:Uncharacterized protein n=1 Tax=Opisthorchis felineus TaxID=147828 RepID=A0A4S2MFC1_OPIFE|nr:hypothetical protein CRM22_000394 [Opisthorchis felineus]
MDDHEVDRCFNKAFLCYESILKQGFDEIPSAQTLVNLEGLHADALNDALEELERLHPNCDQTLGTVKLHRTELISQAQRAFETRRRKVAKEQHKGISEQSKLAVVHAQPLRIPETDTVDSELRSNLTLPIRNPSCPSRLWPHPGHGEDINQTGNSPNRRLEILEEARKISSKLFAMAKLELNNISTDMDPEFERLETLLDNLEELDDRNRGISHLTK